MNTASRGRTALRMQDGTSEGAAVGAAADVAGASAQARVEALAKVAHQQHAPATQLLLAVLDLNRMYGVHQLKEKSSMPGICITQALF